MEEELINSTETTEEVKAEETSPVDQVAKNNEAIIKQQQATIEQLIKQQELTQKVNQQLNKKIAQMSSDVQTNNNNEHWVDKVLRENFDYRIRYDLKTEGDRFLKDSNSTKQLASWWLQYNKSKGLSNDEIATKYKKMAEVMQGAVHSEDI